MWLLIPDFESGHSLKCSMYIQRNMDIQDCRKSCKTTKSGIQEDGRLTISCHEHIEFSISCIELSSHGYFNSSQLTYIFRIYFPRCNIWTRSHIARNWCHLWNFVNIFLACSLISKTMQLNNCLMSKIIFYFWYFFSLQIKSSTRLNK